MRIRLGSQKGREAMSELPYESLDRRGDTDFSFSFDLLFFLSQFSLLSFDTNRFFDFAFPFKIPSSAGTADDFDLKKFRPPFFCGVGAAPPTACRLEIGAAAEAETAGPDRDRGLGLATLIFGAGGGSD